MACNDRILKRNLADPYWKPNLPVISSFLWGTQILEENLSKTRLDSHGAYADIWDEKLDLLYRRKSIRSGLKLPRDIV